VPKRDGGKTGKGTWGKESLVKEKLVQKKNLKSQKKERPFWDRNGRARHRSVERK